MKKLAFIIAASFITIASANAQSKQGPAYKNAHPADKYDGTSTVLVEENPGTIQGPAYKNYQHKPVAKAQGSGDYYVSINRGTYEASSKGVKTFKSVELKSNENKKSLKGPAYKNYRAGRK